MNIFCLYFGDASDIIINDNKIGNERKRMADEHCGDNKNLLWNSSWKI